MTTTKFVPCESVDGWSLHAQGSTDEAIANGDAPALVDGPWEDDDHIIPAWAYRAAELVGQRVEGGEGEDYDTGRVERIDSPTMAYVAWDSGVKTPAIIADLRTI